ncbi:zwei Ig domain protein zig-8-like [Oratosquilla oratoria]|uniref:zwei Ig domain protein zig-8-like n=1 Tax=Oratosquilla oratoria TaxID=337810 RepID=UPI003F7698EF
MNVGVGGVGGVGAMGGTGANAGDGTTSGNVGNNSMTSVRPGQSAKLACPVPSGLYGMRVSWVRRRDTQLLAVGEKIYTTDSRFFVTHSRHVQVWFLHVLNVTKEDEGEYECQTSTHPHVSLLMFLKVSRTYSKILGASERVVASGSVLSLTCSLKNFTTQPEYVFWFQGDKMINFDTGRNVQVTTGTDFRYL